MRASKWVVGSLVFSLLGSCGVDPNAGPEENTGQDPDEIVGANAVARTLSFSSYVYVEPDASNDTIMRAVQTQTRTLFGPLRNQRISLDDREVATINAQTFQREMVNVVDPANRMAPPRAMLRVRYSYSGRAVVDKPLQYRRTLPMTVLFGNYQARATDIIRDCTDDPEATHFGASGLWYMFNPSMSSCQTKIRAEVTAVDNALRGLDRRTQTTTVDTNRTYLPVTIALAPIQGSRATRYPEYDRLLGVGAGDPNKRDLHAYAFFGVIGDREDDPNDDGFKELFFVMKKLRTAYPRMQITDAQPTVDLLDLRINGTRVPNVTYDSITGWVLGTSAPPSGITRTALLTEISRVWRTRTINLSMPITVSSGNVSHPLNVQVHLYYGDEGSAWSTAARERYVSAWRNADLFMYSGHSHLGSGPLDPGNFTMESFPNHYQIFLVNSCVSYNYYNRDFYNLHPGGSRNLDMIVNGTEAYGDNGHVLFTLIRDVIDRRQRSWAEVLRDMVTTDPSLGLYNYDPLRVVDGEEDNVYNPTRTPITLTVAP